jgi:hypothetical protein
VRRQELPRVRDQAGLADFVLVALGGTLATLACLVRVRAEHRMLHMRDVTDTIRRTVLRPPPPGWGGLDHAGVYLTADETPLLVTDGVTDGMTEARDGAGAFYPLADEVARAVAAGPRTAGPDRLAAFVRDGTLRHGGGRPAAVPHRLRRVPPDRPLRGGEAPEGGRLRS